MFKQHRDLKQYLNLNWFCVKAWKRMEFLCSVGLESKHLRVVWGPAVVSHEPIQTALALSRKMLSNQFRTVQIISRLSFPCRANVSIIKVNSLNRRRSSIFHSRVLSNDRLYPLFFQYFREPLPAV
jgi:hypothetical protein